MDVDILAKLIKDIVLVQDGVSLSGLGTFYTEIVPSSFSDKGYTIHPPYRRLSFSPRPTEDGLLAEQWADESGKPLADAQEELSSFLSRMKEVLKQRKTITLPGLGRLRATQENHFFFVADEDLDIYPAGFGLQSISLKNHQGFAEEATVIPDEPEVVPEEPEVIPEEPAATPEAAPAPEAPEAPAKRRRRFPVALIVLISIAVLFFAALAILGRVAPELIDKILYTPEEIENIKLLNL